MAALSERAAARRVAEARARGNVIRLLPLTATDAELVHGLDLLEESLGDADAGGG